MSERREEWLEPGDLEAIRSAVHALRTEIEGRFGGADSDSNGLLNEFRERLETFDPLTAYELLRDRYGWTATRERNPEVDAFGFDREALEAARPALDYLYQRWWRVQVSGDENIPEDGPVIFVCNRSGVLPYDGLMLSHAIESLRGARRRPRFLVADWLNRLPFVQSNLSKLGGVRACAENAERLVNDGHWLIVFPEGQKGALKLFHDRYRLQRFARGGFVAIAIHQRARLVPVSIVGAEEVHPVLFESHFMTRVLGFPALLTPTFPHLGPLGLVPLPSRWRIRFGEPIGFEDMDADAAEDPLYLNRITAQVRGAIQAQINEELRRRPSVF